MRFLRLLVLIPALALAAQGVPNLSGQWQLDLARSSYGSFPAPQSMMRRILHNDPKLIMTTIQRGAQGEVTSQLTYTTDGKESVNKSGSSESKGIAQWLGDKLVIETSREFQGVTLKQKELWTLAGDGKMLTIDAHVSLPNGEFDVKQVFIKQ